VVASEYRFTPGQFNMLYLFGVGEIPISIVSDPARPGQLIHTIRDVGRVSHGFSQLEVGDRIGLRGPFGRGWPLVQLEGQDIMIVTGGLGCAPVVSVINYILRRRERYGRLVILQGVKHSSDLIWRERYAEWEKQDNTQVLLAADVGGKPWPGFVGPITVLFEHARFNPQQTERGLQAWDIWISMERNMQCAVGQCGHCQFGSSFVCRNGPVYRYPDASELLAKRGF
jgi:NAD(P)H-flavin reductase